jgi:hypothetical protein
MADVATHVRIFEAMPSDDLVTKRVAVAKDLGGKFAKDTNVDALLAVVDGVARGSVKGGAMPEPMATLVETSIRDQSTAFVRADNELQLATMGILGLDQAITAAKPSASLSAGDVLATATWLALSFQPPSADLKLEALRTEVLASARTLCLESASRARVRKPIAEVNLDAIADLAEAHTKIKTAVDGPITALRENAIIDREEIDFLWFALGDYSPSMKRQLSVLSPPVAALAAGFDAAQKLRRLPGEGHKHVVLRHVRPFDPLALKALVAAVEADRNGFSDLVSQEKVSKFPAIFGLLSALAKNPPAPAGTGEAVSLGDWAARALLEAGLLRVLSQLPGPKV